jgi:hypothetical protein
MQLRPVLLLNLRNLLVVVLLIWLLAARAPARLAGSFAWPAQAARRLRIRRDEAR